MRETKFEENYVLVIFSKVESIMKFNLLLLE